MPDVCGLSDLKSDLWLRLGALALKCSGLVGRRLDRGNVLWYAGIGDKFETSSASSERSSSACSGMFGSIASPLHDTGYDSSIALLSGLLLRPELKGDAGRLGAVWPKVMNRPLESTPGDECALCINGIVIPREVCGRPCGVEGE